MAFRDERRYLPGLLANLEGQVDGIVALDDQSVDGSAALVESHPLVLDLLRVEPGAQAELEDGRNHRTLVEAAWAHGPGWLLGIDADERVERGFRERAQREIRTARRSGHDALWVHFRELWDGPDRYRADGIWGAKRKACLFESSRGHVFDDRRVHAHWASQAKPVEALPQAELLLYHLRMIEPADRAARLARYRRIDPDSEWQEIGYDYLLDEAGLRLVAVDPARDYHPWP